MAVWRRIPEHALALKLAKREMELQGGDRCTQCFSTPHTTEVAAAEIGSGSARGCGGHWLQKLSTAMCNACVSALCDDWGEQKHHKVQWSAGSMITLSQGVRSQSKSTVEGPFRRPTGILSLASVGCQLTLVDTNTNTRWCLRE